MAISPDLSDGRSQSFVDLTAVREKIRLIRVPSLTFVLNSLDQRRRALRAARRRRVLGVRFGNTALS